MATTQLQLRRGTDAENNAFTGAEGELTYDTTNKTLRIHDGFTAGGAIIQQTLQFVHNTGDENISGSKKFTNMPTQVSTNMDRTTTPTENSMCGYRFSDKNNKLVGEISVKRFASNDKTYIHLYTCENGTNDADDWHEILQGWYDSANSRSIVKSGFFQGIAQQSNWADLAEQYQSDEKYSTGTLIKFGGEKDITIADTEVNGVISDKPGLLLDSELENSQPVALVGKTPVRISGKVNKFDKITLSEVPGIGRVAKEGEKVIARALESSEIEDEKLVMCVTKFNLD